jgi:hypothetical protein
MNDMNVAQTGPGPGKPLPRGRLGAGARWLAGLAVAVVLAGGSVLGVTLSGGGTPQAARAELMGSASGDNRGATAAGATGQAMTASAGMRACVTSAKGLRAAGHRAAARARLHSCMRRHLRMRAGMRAGLVRLWLLARRALHGQITIATKQGPRTIAFERGTIQSLSGSSVVVKAADGIAWTWQIGGATRIVNGGQPVGSKALAAGKPVFVVGQVAGGSDEARRITIRG